MRIDNSIQQVYLDIKLYRYTKKPILLIIQLVSLGLLIFNSLNIDCYKLVFINKPKSIIKVVIDSSSFSRVFQCIQTKLVQKYTFMDAIYTFNSTLILKYSAKLLKYSLIYRKTIHTQHFKIVITISKYSINTICINSLKYI